MARIKKEEVVDTAKSKKMAAIQAACKALQDKFGKESVNFLGNKKPQPIPRFSTGCMSIDKITGGGYPIGRMIQIFGGPSAGKTTLCYHAIAEAQKKYPDKWCGFVDSQQTFDAEYASSVGVNVGELVTAQPDSGTDAFGMIQGMIENGASLIVIDSVAAMMPKEEAEEEDYGHNTIGAQARMMSKGLRKLTAIAGKYKCTLIFTNQTRIKIGTIYGDPSCITLDTLVEIFDMNSMTMESLFLKAGLNYKDMLINESYDISDKNIKIKSYNHKTNNIEFKRILSLVRKQDSCIYQLVTKKGDVLLKCSGAHKIYDNNKKEYFEVKNIESGIALNNNKETVEFFVKKTNEKEPIVDLEVEGNANYFTNRILSHNTVTGGNALTFYSSVRLKIQQSGKVEETINGEKVIKAIEFKVTTVKNKVYAPFKSANGVIVFGKGIDNDASVIDIAISAGYIQKKGGWYAINGENVAQGIVKLKEYLESHEDIYEDIKKKTNEFILNDKKESEVIEESIDAENMTDDEIAEKASKSDEDEADVGEV